MKTYTEGEKSKAICTCELAEGVVDTTFKIRDVPLSDGTCTVKGILVSACDVCDRVVATPPQSTPAINAAIKAHRDALIKTSYLASDSSHAITSYGEKFFIGETVGHQGVENGETAIIESFSLDKENADIVVVTDKGICTIEFLLKM